MLPRPRTLTRRAAVLAGTTALGAALVLPVTMADASTSLGVKLSEFKVTPAKSSVSHGKVTFKVQNTGSLAHELVVIKTTKKAAQLASGGGAATEKGRVGEVELAAHKRKNLTLNLAKGHYALICNIGGHYMAGMHADLTVR